MRVFVKIIVILLINSCFANYYSNSSREDHLSVFDKEKLPRFLTFNTDEHGDVEVELEFKVPFLSVPVKRAMETMHTMGWASFLNGEVPSANLNMAALVLGGAVILGTAVAVPAFSTLLSKKHESLPNAEKRRDNDISQIFQVVEKLLIEYDIDSSSCLQRVMCRVTKTANSKLRNGNAGSYDLIISGLVKNSIFNNFIEHTALHAAISAGLNNNNCLAKYRECRVTQKTIHKIVNTIGNMLSNSNYI